MHNMTKNMLNYYLISIGVYIKYTKYDVCVISYVKKYAEYANQYAKYFQYVNMQIMFIYVTKQYDMICTFALLLSIPGNLYDQYAEYANQYAQYDQNEPHVQYALPTLLME